MTPTIIVYRNNLKAEKSRKERADKAAAKVKAKEPAAQTIPTISIDPSLASTSTKGKSKAHPAPAAHTLPADESDVAMEDGLPEEQREVVEFADPNDRSASEDEEAVEESEEEPVQDAMAIEQHELRQDLNGSMEANTTIATGADDW